VIANIEDLKTGSSGPCVWLPETKHMAILTGIQQFKQKSLSGDALSI
jgi:hypothetical protein